MFGLTNYGVTYVRAKTFMEKKCFKKTKCGESSIKSVNCTKADDTLLGNEKFGLCVRFVTHCVIWDIMNYNSKDGN